MRGVTGEGVGWVERSDTHRFLASRLMGFAALYPSYETLTALAWFP